jgi:RNA polymerase sigma-70 factor (ECF subfamily)
VSAPPAFREQLIGAIPRLRRYARSLVFDAATADDIVQIALERALGHWRQFDPRRELVLWLLAIAHNAFLDSLRRDRHLEVVAPDQLNDTLDRHRQSEPDIGLQMDLSAALARLGADQRSALMLVVVEQLSYAEAADVLQVPAGTVMSRVSRARAALRESLEGGAGARAATSAGSKPDLRRVI